MSNLEHDEDNAAKGEGDLPLAPPTGGNVVITTDARGRVTGLNQAAELLLGRSSADAWGAALVDLFVIVRAKTQMPWTDLVEDIVRTGTHKGLAGRAELISRAGRAYPIADEVTFILDSRSEVAGLGLVFENTAERVRLQGAEPRGRTGSAETGPEKAEEQLKITQFGIDHAQISVFQADDDANIYYANEQASKDLGYSIEELTGMTIMDINPTFDFERWKKHRARTHASGVVSIETTHRRKDGSEFPVEVTINRVAFGDKRITFSFAKNITDRKRSEEERRRFDEHVQKTQRLESLSVLAGGIAHDFNNLLGGIYGYIDLAKEVSKDDAVTQYLVKSLSTIDRARSLTRQLLTFSKGGEPARKVVPLFPLVEDTARFALSGSKIECRFDVPDDLWPCSCDSNQLGQVIDNIAINAKQAMPMGGTVTVSAENLSLRETEHLALRAGRYVKLSFRDTGVGMPKEILSRIFDPFFTTKQVGSGLGLAASYSIIKRHEGHIEVASEPGKGATFFIYLPASAEAAESVDARSVRPRTPLRDGGRILIMDDERVIRDITEALCTSLGYSAVSASNGQEVVRVFTDERAAGRPFAAVILDLTVPGGMGGGEVIHEIREIDADVPVFVSSGYADDPVMANPTRYGFTDCLRKPFMRSDLDKLLTRHLQR